MYPARHARACSHYRQPLAPPQQPVGGHTTLCECGSIAAHHVETTPAAFNDLYWKARADTGGQSREAMASQGEEGRVSGDYPGRLAAGTRVAGYRVEKLVAPGGMAEVYQARDERLGRPVALKVLVPALAADREFRRRLSPVPRRRRRRPPPHHPHLRSWRGRRGTVHRHAPRDRRRPEAGS